MPDGSALPRTTAERDSFSANISARWIPVLRPFMANDEAPGLERGHMIRGVQIEPHPVEGATIMATNGWMMAVVWDRKGSASKAVRVELPERLMDACNPPKVPELWSEGELVKTPPLPDWMVPHRLWLTDISAMVIPRDGGKNGIFDSAIVEESNVHNWGHDYRRHNRLVEWNTFTKAGPVPFAGVPALAAIVLRKLVQSCEAACGGHNAGMRFWHAGLEKSEALFVRFDTVKNLAIMIMPRKVEDMMPVPGWFQVCKPLVVEKPPETPESEAPARHLRVVPIESAPVPEEGGADA